MAYTVHINKSAKSHRSTWQWFMTTRDHKMLLIRTLNKQQRTDCNIKVRMRNKPIQDKPFIISCDATAPLYPRTPRRYRNWFYYYFIIIIIIIIIKSAVCTSITISVFLVLSIILVLLLVVVLHWHFRFRCRFSFGSIFVFVLVTVLAVFSF